MIATTTGTVSGKWMRIAVVLVASLMLAACSRVTLNDGLDERQANRVLGVLLANGIKAEKRTSIASDSGYQVRVGQGDFALAMQILEARGLPGESFQSTTCEVFQRQGFVSSATEQRGQEQCGLQQDLSRTLSSYAGVAHARVHIAMPERDPVLGKVGLASASVVVFEQAGANVRNEEHNFKVLVKDAVPGLENINHVTIKFNTLPAPTDLAGQGRAQPVMSAMSPVTLAIVAGVIALLALAMTFGNRLRARLKGPAKPDDRIWKG
ncbi:hypothetical protein ACW7G2_11415 [Luteimonas sp. A277]